MIHSIFAPRRRCPASIVSGIVIPAFLLTAASLSAQPDPAQPFHSYLTWTAAQTVVHQDIDLFSRPVSLIRPGAAVSSTWTGGTGNFSNAAMWTNGVPNGNFNALIDGGNPVASVVSLDINASLNNLTISKGDTFGFNNNQALTVNGTSISNAGQLNLNSGGNSTELIIGGAHVTLSGAGTLTMSNNSNNYIFGTVGTNVFTNQQTIQGAGVIGNGQLTLVNSGTIDANVSNQLVINPSGGTTNAGTLEATAAGTLNLQGIITNTSGTIQAIGAGSTVTVNNAAITGGTLTTSTGGTIQSFGGTFSGLTNAGTLQVPNNSAATLVGTLTNTGTIQLNSGGNNTVLAANGSVTLVGGGAVTLSDNVNNTISGGIADSLTNQNNTISGAGNIGNNAMAFTNNGVVDAISAGGNHLVIQTGASGATNTGTFEASSGGTLEIQNSLTNTGGTVQALAGTGTAAGGTVLLNGSTITGGLVEGLGTGVNQGFVVSTGATLNTLTTAGTVQVPNNNTLSLGGTITNTGTIQLNSGGNNTVLAANGSVTLVGGGAITLSDNVNNIISGGAADSLTNQNNTISGAGNIGNNAMAFTNNGVVDAISAGGNHLVIQTGASGATNTGTFEASSGGTLEIQNALTNTGGTVQALAGTGTAAGGTVLLNGSTITGGLVEGLGTGVNQGFVVSTGATLSGLTTAGTLQVPNNNTLSLLGTINNTGTIQLNSGGNATELLANGAVTLKGSGTIVLSDNFNNYIFGTAGSSILNENNTIVGAGNIGNGVTSFTNEGTVDAASTVGNHLIFDAGSAVVNTSLMEASSGGNLDIETTVTNTNGTIEALAGGVVELKGATIKGGILTTTGSGVISSAGTTLDALTLSGKLDVPNNQSTVIEGTIVDTGSISLLSGGNGTRLKIGGASVTLQGTGSVSLSDNVNNFIQGASTGKEDLINELTISGAGNIGNNFMTLTNEGDIYATSKNNNHLIVQPGPGGATNTGTMAATGTATLELENTFTNTSGTISASGTGATVQLDGSAVITGGTLSGSGVFVSLGATLNSLTNAGTLQTPNNNTLNLGGTINNTGSIQLNSGGNATELLANGTVTLTGSGKVTLSDNVNNFIFGTAGSTLVNANNTISGAGYIGNNTIAFINQGTVDATSASGNHLVIDAAGAGATNTAIMEASSGGTLDLQNTITNTGGTISALAGTGTAAGGTVVINGGVITGGTLTSAGTGVNEGVFVSNGGTLVNLTNAGMLQVPNNQSSYLQGSIVNSGSILVNSGGNGTFLKIDGNVTLSGSGTVTLSNNSNNYIQGATTGSEVLTNSSTIQGAGNIGNGFMGLVNNGLINANQSNGLFIDASAGFKNTGTLEAGAGSLLAISGPFSNFSGTTLTGGSYVVEGTLQFTGANIVTNAASITLSGAGSQILNQNNTNALTNFTTNAAAGKFTIAGGQSLITAAGNFTNAGALTIGTGSTFTVGNGGNTSIATNYTQTGGATTVDGTLTSSPSAAGTPTVTLQAGSLFGDGTVDDAVKSSGIVTPGNSATATGKLAVDGAYTQSSSGALDISIGGTAVGTKYDQLNVTGSAVLSGTLNIKSLNGFVPTVGTTFDILNATNLLGTFSTVTGTAINATEHYVVSYSGDEVILTVASGAAANSPASVSGTTRTNFNTLHLSTLETIRGNAASTGFAASALSHRNAPGVPSLNSNFSRMNRSIPTRTLNSFMLTTTRGPALNAMFAGTSSNSTNLASTSFAATSQPPANYSQIRNISRNNPGAAPFGTTGYRKVVDYHLELGTIIRAAHAGHGWASALREIGSQYNRLGYITYE